MIPRSWSRHVCQACRSDLQRLVNNGSFHTRTALRPSTFRSIGTKSLRSDLRYLSSSSHLKDARTRPEDVEREELYRNDAALEKEMSELQETAIAELEAKLGMTLEQAIAEERLNAPKPDEQTELITQDGLEVSIEDTESPLEQLRASGASEQELAREARQIFGEFLPEGVLNDEETKIYKRLYGEPLAEDPDEYAKFDIEDAEDVDISNAPSNALFDTQGEQVRYQLESKAEILNAMDKQGDPLPIFDEEEDVSYANNSAGHISAGALADSTDRAKDVANAIGAEVMENEMDELDEEADEEEESYQRTHPLTRLGKFSTRPKTTFLPQAEFVRPVQKIMSDYSNRQLKQMCEKIFGGPGLPDSPLTPRSGRSRKQVAIPLDASQHIMGQMEANAFITSVMPPTYASILATLVETRKRLGATWIRKLLSQPGGPRVLDAGSGGVGILAWREVIKAHWETQIADNGNPTHPPASKTVVLTGSDALRHRAAEMLENTTFIPRLPDYVHARGMPTLEDDRPAQQRKQFDVVIASHSLLPLKEEWERKQHVQNLWSLLSNDGGVLILIEKGFPRGFEALAGARELLLERFIASPEGHSSYYASQKDGSEESVLESPGMIIAPCTNHERCPLYRTSGPAHGRKDICSVQQRYIRPPFLQRILGAKDRNHDDVEFSYLSVMKGDDLRNRHISTWEQVDDPISAPTHSDPSSLAETATTWMDNLQQGLEHFKPEIHLQSPAASQDQHSVIKDYPDGQPRSNLPTSHVLPRVIYPPLKRRGHVTFDVCTPAGNIERWTVPKSFSKQAYRDARKARWGDLWALGAKTCTPRNVKVGMAEKDLAEKMKGSLGKARSKKERRRMLADTLTDAEDLDREREMEDIEELRNLIEEDDLIDEDDGDGTMIDMDTLLPVRQSKAKSKAQSIERSALSDKDVHDSSSSTARYGEEDNLSSWAGDFSRSAVDTGRSKRAGSGKHGGAFAGRGSESSKAAKREQKRRARSLR